MPPPSRRSSSPPRPSSPTSRRRTLRPCPAATAAWAAWTSDEGPLYPPRLAHSARDPVEEPHCTTALPGRGGPLRRAAPVGLRGPFGPRRNFGEVGPRDAVRTPTSVKLRAVAQRA